MGFIQLFETRNEIEASLLKGNLESVGIKTIISPINNNSPLNGSWLTVQDVPYGVYVEDVKVDEARKFLTEGK